MVLFMELVKWCSYLSIDSIHFDIFSTRNTKLISWNIYVSVFNLHQWLYHVMSTKNCYQSVRKKPVHELPFCYLNMIKDSKRFKLKNMIMAMPLKPAPNLDVISNYRMKFHWAVAKLSYLFHLFDVWDGPLSTTFSWAMTWYNPRIVTLWCVEVGPVANASESSTQEHDRARVAGHMLCSSQASGSPFWISWRSRSRGYKRDILSTIMSELWLNSWHAPIKLLRNRVNKLTRCSKIAARSHFISLASLLHATFIKKSLSWWSAHKLLMIPHTNFEIFDDSAHKFWRMVVHVQH